MLKNNLAEPEEREMCVACDQVVPFLAIDSNQWFAIALLPGDMWPSLETFWVVKIEGCYELSWVKPRDAAGHPTVIWAQMSTVPRVRNSARDISARMHLLQDTNSVGRRFKS